MRPSPLSLAATVTYHRIILISRGKTAGGSWPSSPTFLHFPRPRRLLAFSCPRLEKRNRLRPLDGGVDGGWPPRLNPPRPAFIPRFPGSRGGGRRLVRGNAQNPSLPCPFVRSRPIQGMVSRDSIMRTDLRYQGESCRTDFEKLNYPRMDEIQFQFSFFRKKKEKRTESYRKCKKRGDRSWMDQLSNGRRYWINYQIRSRSRLAMQGIERRIRATLTFLDIYIEPLDKGDSYQQVFRWVERYRGEEEGIGRFSANRCESRRYKPV